MAHATASSPRPTGPTHRPLGLFNSAREIYSQAKRFNARYPDLQLASAYLKDLAVLGDPDLDAQVRDLTGRLNFEFLWRSEVTLPALIDQFSHFRDRYALAYRRAHRDFHSQLQTIDEMLAGLDDKLTVLDRLNGLELGAPVGAGLPRDVAELRDRVHPCALKDDCRVDAQPRCNTCRWDGEGTPPRDEAQRLATRVADASGELCKRVAQDAVRKIFDAGGRADVRTLLDMITASRIEDLVRVLTPEMVKRRDLAVRTTAAAASEPDFDDVVRRGRGPLPRSTRGCTTRRQE
ncbi:MAG TPA: hypothetical protein VMV69_22255 [Pirellulales bacterium]|nr:hypothetical protein [Pirellulales bacterium]